MRCRSVGCCIRNSADRRCLNRSREMQPSGSGPRRDPISGFLGERLCCHVGPKLVDRRHQDSKDLMESSLLVSNVSNCSLCGVDRHACPVFSRMLLGSQRRPFQAKCIANIDWRRLKAWMASHFQMCNGKFLIAALIRYLRGEDATFDNKDRK